MGERLYAARVTLAGLRRLDERWSPHLRAALPPGVARARSERALSRVAADSPHEPGDGRVHRPHRPRRRHRDRGQRDRLAAPRLPGCARPHQALQVLGSDRAVRHSAHRVSVRRRVRRRHDRSRSDSGLRRQRTRHARARHRRGQRPGLAAARAGRAVRGDRPRGHAGRRAHELHRGRGRAGGAVHLPAGRRPRSPRGGEPLPRQPIRPAPRGHPLRALAAVDGGTGPAPGGGRRQRRAARAARGDPSGSRRDDLAPRGVSRLYEELQRVLVRRRGGVVRRARPLLADGGRSRWECPGPHRPRRHGSRVHLGAGHREGMEHRGPGARHLPRGDRGQSQQRAAGDGHMDLARGTHHDGGLPPRWIGGW